MLPGFGGPMGRHAAPRGPWFTPLLWVLPVATVLFLVLFLRHVPCVQVDAANPINAYIRACYSDIQVTYLSQGLGDGASPLTAETLAFPPLIAALILIVNRIVFAVFGLERATDGDLQPAIDASVAFFGVTVVLLFIAFLVLAFAFTRLGRDDRARSSWEAVVVAGSPIVLAVGLIDWTLIPVALTAVGLVQFARGRTPEAGILLGIAACAGTMPIGVVLAVAVACGLRGGWGALLRFAGPAVATFLAVHLPLLLNGFDRVYAFYHGEINKELSYGSLWYLASQFGLPIRHAGSLAFVLLLLALACLIAYLYVARRRPRVGSLVAAVILATALFGPAFPPQTALWLLLAVLLARPYRPELIALTVTQVAYYLAVWGWIGGALTPAQLGPYGLYWLAIGAWWSVAAYILAETVIDMARPQRDWLRTPDVPDPIGGELNRRERLAPLPPVEEPQPVAAVPARPFALEDIYRSPAGEPEAPAPSEGPEPA